MQALIFQPDENLMPPTLAVPRTCLIIILTYITGVPAVACLSNAQCPMPRRAQMSVSHLSTQLAGVGYVAHRWRHSFSEKKLHVPSDTRAAQKIQPLQCFDFLLATEIYLTSTYVRITSTLRTPCKLLYPL
jgi:hypothetical protein